MSARIPVPQADFDLSQIFGCGQCFRWEEQADGSWEGVAKQRIVNVRYDRQEADAGGQSPAAFLTISPCSDEELQEVWAPYFDLIRDYGAVKRKLAREDPVLRRAIQYGAGIRILRQDVWETILTFLISQNSNIPRIRGCVERLADLAGEPLGTDRSGRIRSDLPGPEVLARMTEQDLAPVRLGYRARYLIRASQEVLDRGMPETYEELLALTGVGPKVASCAALFGLGETDRFPLDVWMKRVMHECYGFALSDGSGMAAYARDHFGSLAGFAQQYLFYFIRQTDM